MTPTTPVQDLATQWSTARRLYPIYFELAREFAIDVQPCADLEAGVDTPGKDTVEQANHWLEAMDQLIQVHQLRQFLQTSSLVNQEGLVSLLQHFLAIVRACLSSPSHRLPNLTLSGNFPGLRC